MGSIDKRRAGFTLVEIMIVVVIIGLLASIAVPGFQQVRKKAQATTLGVDMRALAASFGQFAMENGSYPASAAPGNLPAGMVGWISEDTWLGDTPIGGNFGWINISGGGFSLALLYVSEPDTDVDTLVEVDEIIDDGDLFDGAVILIGGLGLAYCVECGGIGI